MAYGPVPSTAGESIQKPSLLKLAGVIQLVKNLMGCTTCAVLNRNPGRCKHLVEYLSAVPSPDLVENELASVMVSAVLIMLVILCQLAGKK